MTSSRCRCALPLKCDGGADSMKVSGLPWIGRTLNDRPHRQVRVNFSHYCMSSAFDVYSLDAGALAPLPGSTQTAKKLFSKKIAYYRKGCIPVPVLQKNSFIFFITEKSKGLKFAALQQCQVYFFVNEICFMMFAFIQAPTAAFIVFLSIRLHCQMDSCTLIGRMGGNRRGCWKHLEKFSSKFV